MSGQGVGWKQKSGKARGNGCILEKLINNKKTYRRPNVFPQRSH